MTLTKYPNNGLVAEAWIGQRVPDVTAAMVASRLPREFSTWKDNGFVVISPIGGTPDVDIPVRHPLVQVDVYAVTVDAAGNASVKPPIGKAYAIAENIRVATESPAALYSRPVTMPAGYVGAIVFAAYVVGELFEVPDDPSGYARITFNLAVDWARA